MCQGRVMINKLNDVSNLYFNKENNARKTQQKFQQEQRQSAQLADIPAETYRAYSVISFKGKQNDDCGVISAIQSALDAIKNTSPDETVSVNEAVEILRPLMLTEKKLLDYLMACSYDSHDENVQINRHALYYTLLLHGDYRNVPDSKIPNVIASSLDNENKCFSENKFNFLFDMTGRLRLSKRNSLKRIREEGYPNARKIALIHKAKLSADISAILKEQPVQKEYDFDIDSIFSVDINKEKNTLSDTISDLKNNGQLSQGAAEAMQNALKKNNFNLKQAFSDYYSLLNDCKTLEEAKELYPELTIPDLDFKNNGFDRVLKSRLAREDMDKVGLDILKKVYVELKPVSSIVVDLENSYPTTYQSMIKGGISFGKVSADVSVLLEKTDRLTHQFNGIENVSDKELEFLIRKNASKQSRVWAEYMGITNKYWHPVRAIAHKQKHPLTSYYQTDKLVNGYLFYLYKYQNKVVPSENPFEQYADGKPFNKEKKAALEKIYFLYRNNHNEAINSKDFLEFKENFDTEAMAKSLTKFERHYKNTFSNWFMTHERRQRYEAALEDSYRLVFEKMDIAKNAQKMQNISVADVVEDKLTNEELVDYIAETEPDETETIKEDFKRLRNIVNNANNQELTNLFNQYVGSNSADIDCDNFLQFKPLIDSCINNNEIDNPKELIAMFKLHNSYMNYLFNTSESTLTFEDYKQKIEQEYKAKDGTVDYTQVIKDMNAEEEYLQITGSANNEEKNALINLLDKKFISNNKNNYKTAIEVLTMYDELPEIFKNRFYNLAVNTDKINDNIFLSQLQDMYKKITAWNLDRAEIITMDADKIPQNVVITSKAKYELLEDCNGNIERFDTILNKFYAAATKRVGDKQGQGVKVLGENIQYAAELKIQGGDAIGSKRLYAREALPEDIQKYGNAKYVFDTLDEHL